MEKLIGDLLLRHNCVIVPSFGGFVAKPIPAKINFEKGTMVPPSKSLLFNKQLINNDGLLINELASQNGISFNDASVEVASKVQVWNKALKSGGRIELDRVGNLYLDEDNNVQFEQDRFFNLLLESFGLGQVQFVAEEAEPVERKVAVKEPVIIPISRKSEKEELTEPKIAISSSPAAETITSIPAVETEKRRRPVWRYIAAACLIPIGFYSIWIPMKTDVLESGILSIKDFNPFYKSAEGTYAKNDLVGELTEKSSETSLKERLNELPNDVDVYSYKVDDANYIPVAIENENEATNNETETLPNENSFSPDAMNFIVGCFGNESNATNLVAKLKAQGFDARIVDFHNGLHRVSAGAALSLDAFAQIKVQAESQGYKGWTLK